MLLLPLRTAPVLCHKQDMVKMSSKSDMHVAPHIHMRRPIVDDMCVCVIVLLHKTCQYNDAKRAFLYICGKRFIVFTV